MKSSTYTLLRLGPHHFAHLRAVAEGLEVATAAERYLGIEHGHQAVTAHRVVVDGLRAIARRRGDRDWRLIGLLIRPPKASSKPSLEDFMAERDLDGWSEAEVLEMYAEAYPDDQRTERRNRLRVRQLELLKQLEFSSSETPQLSDRLDGWLAPEMAGHLQRCGLLLLGDLHDLIQKGGRWWSGIPAMGQGKAQRLRDHVYALLPHLAIMPRPFAEALTRPFAAAMGALSSPAAASLGSGPHTPGAFSAATTLPPLSSPALPSPVVASVPAFGSDSLEPVAETDAGAVEAWVLARAGATATAKAYLREGRRLLIWLQTEQRRGFKQMRAEDCRSYMAFLAHVPPQWSSKTNVAALSPGWAPFRGPLSVSSQRHAVVICTALFDWLVTVGYLSRNPWQLVNRRLGDDRAVDSLDSRAFTPEAWREILRCIGAEHPSPARHRMLFVLQFVEGTGLRAAELLGAKLSDLKPHKGGWVMQVHGKGSRNRVIAVPSQSVQALHDYLAARHLDWPNGTASETPLLASATDPMAPITYPALYQTVKRWLAKAIRQSALPPHEQATALRASPHWLRHTFGTRAVERQAPIEAVQRQLGHADPRTTMRYARTQIDRLQSEMEKAFGGQSANGKA